MKLQRSNLLLEKVLFINGQPGCGKTLFTSILPTIKKVEILNFCTEIENICALYHLKKISKDGASTFIKIYLDEVIYNTSMSRRVNFRFGDLSSVFRDPFPLRYFQRLLSKGDVEIPKYIKTNKPILHFATHNILPYSKILFDTLFEKILFMEILRHPLYMIKQQIINYENHLNSDRHFHIKFLYQKKEFFFWDLPYLKNSKNFKPVDFAINHLSHQLDNQIDKINYHNKNKNFLVIPFENFVLSPYKYIKNIELLLGEKFSKKLNNVLQREKVPRIKASDGINSKLYRRFGWEPGNKKLNEMGELNKRLDFVKSLNPLKKNLEILNYSINKYDNFLKKNEYFA